MFRPVTSMVENVLLVEKEKPVLPHHLQHQQQQQQHTQQKQHYTSVHPSINSPSLSEETRKPPQQPPPPNKMNAAISPDFKSKTSPNPAQLDSLKQKPQHPNNSQSHPYPNTTPAEPLKAKPHPGLLDSSKPKPNTSPEVSKHKIQRYSGPSPPPIGRLSAKVEPAEPPRSCFKPVPVRLESGGVSSTKSPFIIDKNETFTVYRDPALVRSAAENSVSVSISSNHVAAYLHPHLHTLHSPSPHSPCLTSASHPHTSHLLAPPHTSALPHPHLLPPGVLPAMPPPTASLLGGHPRLDSPSGLGHLGLPHPAAVHQQQFLQV